jgi:hypothetical protein
MGERRVLAAVGLCAALVLAVRSGSAEPVVDPWAGLRFLVGSWVGGGSGTPGEATGAASFDLDLDGHVMVRRSRADVPEQPGKRAAVHHRDLMVIYPAAGGGGQHAVYFDNEGHVINYAVVASAPDRAVFTSDAAGGGPRFRLVYELDAAGVLHVDFAIAPPGGEFATYTSGTLQRAAAR